MNTLKISSIIGIVIGCIVGYLIAQSMLDDYEACEQIKQENKQLRQIIFEQHQRYYETQ
jgi:uncharacterized membrane-anchored protein YhcB (DUF1043 family)